MIKGFLLIFNIQSTILRKHNLINVNGIVFSLTEDNFLKRDTKKNI